MHNSTLAMIIIAYLVLATVYSVIVPMGEGPDEPGHAAYAYFLAREGRLPVQRYNPALSDVRGEGHQPPLAYGVAALTLLWLPREQRSFDLPGNPRFTWASGDEINAVGHGSREFWPWSRDVLAWHLARLSSVALGAVTVGCTYLAARQLSDERRADSALPSSVVPLLAAALVVFNPQFLFTSALLTNDALLIALSAMLLWLALRGHRRATNDEQRTRWRNALALGVVLGLALITKQSALLLVPIALLGSARVEIIQPGKTGWRKRLAALSPCILVSAIAALISGWWYWRNWQLYGDPLGLTAFTAEFTTQPFERNNPAAWLGALWQIHASFWARFGWMNLEPPVWVLGIYTLLVLVAGVGLVQLLWRMRQGAGVRRWLQSPMINRQSPIVWQSAILTVLIALAFAWIVSFALTAGLVAWQGRLLFPALPASAIVLAIGLERLRGIRQKLQRFSLRWSFFYFLPFTLALLALWLPFGVIQPAYPHYTLPEQKAIARLGTPVYGLFGAAGDPGVELRSWRIAGTAQPGAPLDATLMWYTLGPQRYNWSVFVHLVDAKDETIAGTNGEPNNGVYPMQQWVAGDWVEDTHTLTLPADIAPGTYIVRLGLFNEHGNGERAGRYDKQGKLRGDSLDLGKITVTK